MSGEGASGCSAVKHAVAATAGTISCFRDAILRVTVCNDMYGA